MCMPEPTELPVSCNALHIVAPGVDHGLNHVRVCVLFTKDGVALVHQQ